MSVYKNVRIPLLYSSHKPSNAKNVILPYSRQLDISDKIDENVNNLSGGQRQRTPSPALVNSQILFLADEPVPLIRKQVKNVMNIFF